VVQGRNGGASCLLERNGVKRFSLVVLSILSSSICLAADALHSTYEESRAWGLSLHLDLHNTVYFSHSQEAAEFLQDFIIALCKFIEMKPYNRAHIEWFGKGDQEGYTAVQLIETSALTVHTARRNIYLDLFSCKYYDPEKVARFCAQYLMAEDVAMKVILRK